MQWTIGKIGEALRVAAPFSLLHKSVTGFSIDSRTLRPGEAFIALKGPNHDGHDFIRPALERGAAIAIVDETHRMTLPVEIHKNVIGVLNTFEALNRLAHYARRSWGRAVVGITGSTGKTTTKEMLAALLAARYNVLKSEGNLNNEYGLPLSLLRLKAEHEVAVVEMAMAHKGELAKLCAVAEPNIGLVTNVAPVHLEFFNSVEEIAEAKRELIRGLAAPAIAVLNADDPLVSRFSDGFAGKVFRFGIENPAEVRAENIDDRGCSGTAFDLVAGPKRARVALPLPGRHHISNALAAFAVASLLKVEPADAGEILARFEPAPLRGQLLRFAAGFTVVNDAYNSNPRALTAMAEALSRTPGARRRILVAGEMKELGATSAELHRQVGEKIAALGNIDFLVGVNGASRHLIEGARAAGMSSDSCRFFDKKESAADWLAGFVAEGDWVLLKASRGVALETVLEALQARHPLAEDAAPLVKGKG
ncbi:MAG TPA: UDP-N-acetylmuramoyl-tripeptide--D-alanyl-D-alanine ligase [Candidatus Acidoferrales bacterium]|nr:UDP-N-acetylmuramoyl-tripeptide--D-alanyl-D-alanine ligase [Candidatus Acidoferrales bacterium]